MLMKTSGRMMFIGMKKSIKVRLYPGTEHTVKWAETGNYSSTPRVSSSVRQHLEPLACTVTVDEDTGNRKIFDIRR